MAQRVGELFPILQQPPTHRWRAWCRHRVVDIGGREPHSSCAAGLAGSDSNGDVRPARFPVGRAPSVCQVIRVERFIPEEVRRRAVFPSGLRPCIPAAGDRSAMAGRRSRCGLLSAGGMPNDCRPLSTAIRVSRPLSACGSRSGVSRACRAVRLVYRLFGLLGSAIEVLVTHQDRVVAGAGSGPGGVAPEPAGLPAGRLACLRRMVSGARTRPGSAPTAE